jgi:hypothetical protein
LKPALKGWLFYLATPALLGGFLLDLKPSPQHHKRAPPQSAGKQQKESEMKALQARSRDPRQAA